MEVIHQRAVATERRLMLKYEFLHGMKEVMCIAALVLACAVCMVLLDRKCEGPVASWASAVAVFLLGGQLAVFRSLGLTALL
jgi:small-conductance mechanosensitive channel